MFKATPHPLLIAADRNFSVHRAPTRADESVLKSHDWKQKLQDETAEMGRWQHKLYADGRFALLLIFQALDAAGKDTTIRHVFSGVNPTGVEVTSFKRPTPLELDHDFLWRTSTRLPPRGHIGIFNRSYYEEVLAVRVHPEYLAAQRIAEPPSPELWQQRYAAILAHERHLASEGTVILKFWLNVSREEQRQRFLARIDRPNKRWKFSLSDIAERAHWDQYLAAFDECLLATSRPWAPWYAIPADDKPHMRWQVAAIINAAFDQLKVDFPSVRGSALEELEKAKEQLQKE
jgi:PPK2 family polyphosphate:nucleotide phosphotransferase